MRLNTLSPAPGSTHAPKRVGRGIGAGLKVFKRMCFSTICRLFLDHNQMTYFIDHSAHCRRVLQFHHVTDAAQTEAGQTGFVVGQNAVRALDLLNFNRLGSHDSNLENYFCMTAPQ